MEFGVETQITWLCKVKRKSKWKRTSLTKFAAGDDSTLQQAFLEAKDELAAQMNKVGGLKASYPIAALYPMARFQMKKGSNETILDEKTKIVDLTSGADVLTIEPNIFVTFKKLTVAAQVIFAVDNVLLPVNKDACTIL